MAIIQFAVANAISVFVFIFGVATIAGVKPAIEAKEGLVAVSVSKLFQFAQRTIGKIFYVQFGFVTKAISAKVRMFDAVQSATVSAVIVAFFVV